MVFFGGCSIFDLFTWTSSDLRFQYRGSFRAAVAENWRGSSRIFRTTSVLSHHEHMRSKNNARSSCRCISLCKHFKVAFSLYILTALDILQGGPLVRGRAERRCYIRMGHFLWKALRFFLSPEAKKVGFWSRVHSKGVSSSLGDVYFWPGIQLFSHLIIVKMFVMSIDGHSLFF